MFFRILLTATLVISCFFPKAQGIYEKGELFVRFVEGKGELYEFTPRFGATPEWDALMERAGFRGLYCPFILDHPDLRNTFVLRTVDDVPDALMGAIEQLPDIEYVERVPHYKSFLTPNDPNLGQQWNLATIQAEDAWDINTGNATTTIAIVDDAVHLSHPDLQGNLWVNPGEIANNGLDDDGNGYIDDINGWDAANNDNDPNPPVLNQSYFTHGTHVAGIAAASTNNATGVASIGFNCSIISVKVKDDATTGGSLQAPYLGVQYAIAANPDIMNNSWGGSGSSATYQALFDVAYQNGIVVVAAAGNSNTAAPMYPASYNHVISVGATDVGDQKASFSNYGPTIDVMAPGANIPSTLAATTGLYGNLSGTSMAAPLVAGLAGLMRSYDPSLSVDDLEACLESSCDNINAQNPQYLNQIGAGRINAEAALLCLDPVVPAFTSNFTQVCPGGSVQFTDQTNNNPNAWQWTFQGGVPATSNLQNPVITYPVAGTYDVTLIVTNPYGTDTLVETAYITVATPTATLSGGSTILAGYSSTLQVDFTGNGPWDFTYSDGSSNFTLTGITQNPYYHLVSPTVTTTYNLVSMSDAQCAGTVSGNATVTVITNNSCNGTSSFNRTYGGTGTDWSTSLELTADGGSILAGYTNSFGAGGFDAYVIKLDACGFVEWSKTYGSSANEYGRAIFQTPDGGYILASYSFYSNTNDLTHWLMKLDPLGNITWTRSYDNAPFQYPRECRPAPDGGYIIFGVSGTGAGANDFGAVKVDATGNIQWQKAYGGTANDFGHDINVVPSGGYLAFGYKRNYVADYSLYAVRMDNNGNAMWGREYNMVASNEAAAAATVLSNDQGFLLFGNYAVGGATDGLIIKTDTLGNTIWARRYGGNGDEFVKQVVEMPNGDLAAMLTTTSGGNGAKDLYLARLDAQGNVLSGGPVGGLQDEEIMASGNTFQLSPLGNLTMLARTESFGAGQEDFYLLRTDVSGILGCDTASFLMPSSPVSPQVINNPPTVNNTSLATLIPTPTVTNPPTLEGINCSSSAPPPFCLNIKGHQKISDTQGNFGALLDNGDQFGMSVVEIGDVNGDGVQDLAAGANLDDDGGNDYGAIYILFMNTDGTVQSHQKIASNVGGFTGVLYPLGAMGGDIEAVGDMNNDGIPDLAVGVPRDNDGGIRRGAFFILFMNANGTVASQQKVSDTQGNFTGVLDMDDRFGQNIANLGDMDGNGVNDLAVCAPFDDDGGFNRGAVWILFMNANGTVLNHQKISDTQGGFTAAFNNEDNFGVSVDNMGDFDGNGVTDIVVGARFDDDGGTNRGAVYILLLNANGTVASNYKISDVLGNFGGYLDDNDLFGISVRNIGDLNGDNVEDIIVGAYRDDDGGPDKGAAYILFLNGNGTVAGVYKISETSGNFTGTLGSLNNFSWSVAPIGDLDNNGMGDFAIGEMQGDDGGPNRGAVWIIFMEDSCQCQYGNMLTFQRTYGGTVLEEGHSMTVTSDGNIAVVGVTTSTGAGNKDIFVMKADPSGNPLWMRTYGTAANEDGNSVNIKQTANGGYIVVGHTTIGGSLDPIVLRLDANGNLLWQTRLSGNSDDHGRCVVETSDGGFAVGGSSISYGAGSNDEYLFKLDANGNLLWTRTFGSFGADHVTGIKELANGNLALACHPRSWGVGLRAAETIVTDANGNLVWTNIYDGNQDDGFLSMDVGGDGGFISVGVSNSFGLGGRDAYVVKTDSAGALQWARVLGGPQDDWAVGVVAANDGGYIVSGHTASFGNGGNDLLGFKLDAQGNLDWAFAYGTAGLEKSDNWGNCVAQAADGGYYFWGESNGFSNGGDSDAYLVKTDVCGNSWCHEMDITSQISVLNPNVNVSSPNTSIGSGGTSIPISMVASPNLLPDSIICISNPNPIDSCTVLADFSADTACFGDSTYFTDLSIDTAAINFWVWDFGDGSGIIGVQNPVHLYGAPGSYTVTLVSGNTCTDSISHTVVVTDNVLLTAPNDTTICIGDSIPLPPIVGGCGVPPYSFSWSPSTGLTSTTDSVPIASPSVTTTYTVTVTDFAGNQASDQVTVTIDPNCCVSHAFIGGDSLVCVGSSLQLSNNSNAGANPNYLWDFGPNALPQTFNGANPPPVQFNATGIQQVMLILNDNCGTDTAYKNIYVNPLPIAHAGNDTAVCVGAVFMIGDSTVTYTSYAWTPAMGLSDPSISNPIATVTGPISYVLTVTDDVTGCTSSDTIDISILPDPVISLPADTTVCNGGPLLLTPSITNGSLLQWQDGSSGATFSVAATGWYWAIATNACGADTDSVFVSIPPAATVDLGPDQTACDGDLVTLTANVQNGTIVQWSDGSSGASITVSVGGTYWVEVQGDPACPPVRDSIEVSFNPLPGISLPGDVSLCAGGGFVITATTTNAISIQWQDGSSGSSFNATTTGAYWAIATNACGSDTDSIFVQFIPAPVADLGPDQSACEGDVVQLNANVQNAGTWTWSDGSSGQTLAVTVSGTYWLEATGDPACPPDRDSVEVSFIAPPDVELPGDTTLCSNQAFILYPVTGGAGNLNWSDGSVGPSILVDDPGTVWVSASNNCGSDSDTMEIGVSPPITIFLGHDTTICDDAGLELSPGLGFATYRWQDGSTEPIYLATAQDLYWVQVTDHFGCEGYAQRQVFTENCFYGLFVPNAFTPNGMPPNDLFQIVENGVTLRELQIFDRWGKLIYVANSVNEPWDATFKGQPVPEGAYVYVIQYVDQNGEMGTLKGTVTVLR